MPKQHRPKKGSHGFSPRKRAKKQVPTLKSWPEGGDTPHIQGFAGYKAGMTHAHIKDYRKRSTTAGQEVVVPVTILEAPPLKVCAIRLYRECYEGLQAISDIWAKKTDLYLKGLGKKKKDLEQFNLRILQDIPIKKNANPEQELKTLKTEEVDDVRVLAYTQPYVVKAVPKKIPELMEIRVGGGSIEERIDYAKSILGKELSVNDYTRDGEMVDVIAVTKGKGFQGHVKRWGVKLLTHKNSKHRRMIGNLGPFSPGYVRSSVPQAGQVGYHKRTEYNKRVLKVITFEDDAPKKTKEKSGEETETSMPEEEQRSNEEKTREEQGFAPAGGFLHYGRIHNDYILLHGSVPGPAKRLVRLRDPIRFHKSEVLEQAPEIVYLSLSSKQGA